MRAIGKELGILAEDYLRRYASGLQLRKTRENRFNNYFDENIGSP